MSDRSRQIVIREEEAGRAVFVTMSGKLRTEDYDFLVPEIERLIERHGKIRMMVELVDFHGWTAGAVWEDTRFAARHFADIERLAIVGDRRWEKGMAVFCKPFTGARLRHFDRRDRAEAERWLRARDD